MVDLKIEIRCTLCDCSSNDSMIMMSIFEGKQLFICLDCLAEGIVEINNDTRTRLG